MIRLICSYLHGLVGREGCFILSFDTVVICLLYYKPVGVLLEVCVFPSRF